MLCDLQAFSMDFIFMASVSIFAFFMQSAIMAFFDIGLAFMVSVAKPLLTIMSPKVTARSVDAVVFLIMVMALLSAMGVRRPGPRLSCPIGQSEGGRDEMHPHPNSRSVRTMLLFEFEERHPSWL